MLIGNSKFALFTISDQSSLLVETTQRGVKKSIPHAQALRLRRICTTSAVFEQRAADLTKYLVNKKLFGTK